MRAVRSLLLLLLSLLPLFSLSGCWNYSEIDDMSIVAGVAVDKNPADGKLLLTAELIDTSGGVDKTQAGFKMITLSGDTMFEIVRNMISMTGKKLFWSHAKCIILSEEVAREGLIKAIDWYSRDTETRSDVFVFVSGEKTAREILDLNRTKGTVISFELAQLMRDEKHISSAPVVEIWDFIDKLETRGYNAVAPMIYVHEKNGSKNERVEGTAVFVKDRMTGKLSGEETKSTLLIKKAVEGGVLVVGDKHGKPSYSLEIIANRTKVKPKMVHDELVMEIDTLTTTGLDEMMTAEGFMKGERVEDIEKRAGEELRQNILAVVHKLQREYHSDILGFGQTVHENQPEIWSKVKDRWPEVFADLEVTVSSRVVIQSSAKTSRAIRLVD